MSTFFFFKFAQFKDKLVHYVVDNDKECGFRGYKITDIAKRMKCVLEKIEYQSIFRDT